MSAQDEEPGSKKKPAKKKKVVAKTTRKKPAAQKNGDRKRRVSAPKATKKKKTRRAPATKSAKRSTTRRIRPLPVIGWREWIAVPDLGIGRLKAKADTGARTSALHAIGVRVERNVVHFRVHPVQRNTQLTVECAAPLVGYRSVRSSSGDLTRRPVILTRLVIGDRSWEVEVTLVRRDLMGFRMLLGRQAVRRRLRIDPGRSFLAELPRLGS